MTIEDRTFGTFGRDGKRREDLTLEEARSEVKDDRNDGVFSDVVRYITEHKFIDDTFHDDVVAMHSALNIANGRLATVQAFIESHHSDETANGNLVCVICDVEYPCNVRTELEFAVR